MTQAPAIDFNLSQDEFELVRSVVHEHCGISLNAEKIQLVKARLNKQVRVGGFNSAKEYLDHVLADRTGPAFTTFIDSISTNLTSFFREKQHFDYLTNVFLPKLLEKKRAAGVSRLLGWSAASSSGEEPYSLAMTLLDAGQKNSRSYRWDFRLLATDISTAMLAIARKGVYPSARVAPVPANFKSQYLAPTSNVNGVQVQEVAPEVRQVVRFRHLNLMDAWPFKGPFDFIFCRNVMIYFDQPTQQKLVERFWHCLTPGGLLFTGHSESLTGIQHRFKHVRPSIYEK